MATIKALSQLTGFAVAALLVRLISKDEFGQYTFLITILTITCGTLFSGQGLLLARKQAIQDEPHFLSPGVLKDVVVQTLVNGFLVGIVLLVILLAGLQPAELLGVVLVFALANSFKDLLFGAIKGTERPLAASLNIFLVPLLFMGLLVLASANIVLDKSVVLFLNGLAALAIAIVFCGVVTRWSGGQSEHQSTSLLQTYKEALLVSLASSLNLLNKKLDILMIGLLLSAVAVADYRISVLMAFPLTVSAFLNSIFLTAPLTRLIKNDGEGEKRVRNLMRKMHIFNLAISVAYIVLLVLFGELLITLVFGADYVAALQPAIVLCFSVVVAYFAGPNVLYINLAGESHRLPKLITFGIVVNAALNVILLSAFGIIGAAYATLISAILVNLLVLNVKRSLSDIDLTVWGALVGR